MVKSFPDESLMEKSDKSGDLIRGGSIGLNRILSTLVDMSRQDQTPRFSAMMVSAFTFFRNSYTHPDYDNETKIIEGFIKDLNLLLEYLDIYLSHVWKPLYHQKFFPVILYFPDYDDLPKEIRRDKSDKNLLFWHAYRKFLSRYGHDNKEIRKLDYVRCTSSYLKGTPYPSYNLARLFLSSMQYKDVLYNRGDSIALISSIMLDWYVTKRVRGIKLLKSFTGTFEEPNQFHLKLDSDGRLPFYACLHYLLGDSDLIKTQITPKIKKMILHQASQEHWLSRSEEDIIQRLVKLTDIKPNIFRQYNFE